MKPPPAIPILQASHASKHARVADAVFVPSADPRDWLEETAKWGAPGDEARFYLVPSASEAHTPAGAFILPGIAGPIVCGPKALPCISAHERVWIPLGSRLSPALLPEEIPQLFPYELHFVHPSLGFIGWEAHDAFDASAFIAPAPPQNHTWEMATAGPPAQPRLRQVRLLLPEDVALEFLDQAGNTIGDREISDLKPKNGPGKALARGLGNIYLSALGGLQGMTDRFQGTGNNAAPASPGMMHFLQNWIAKQTEALQAQRENELERLSRLLKENPDEGLRYALPLSGEANARGFAANPGGRLSLRNPTLGRGNQSGGVIDPWNLGEDWTWKLNQQYREVAAAETAKGNHARAAYIYGELLGNWSLAAKALEAGGQYREAATIYRLKLHDRGAEARCLEQAGLLAEAAHLRADLGHHEKSGDLWARIGHRDNAVQAWLAAVKASQTRTHGARIIDSKLKRPDWACAVLASGWPDTNEAIDCLKAHFEILIRCEARQESDHQVTKLASALESGAFSVPIEAQLGALTAIQKIMPWTAQKERIATMGRWHLATHLEEHPPTPERSGILRTLHGFDPGDPLLERDICRFRSRLLMPARLPLRSPVSGALQITRSLQLPAGFQCLDFVGDGTQRWYAVGNQTNGALLLQMGTGSRLIPPRSLGPGGKQAAWILPTRQGTRIATSPTMHWQPIEVSWPDEGMSTNCQMAFEFPGKALAITYEPSHGVKILTPNLSTGIMDLCYCNIDGEVRRSQALGWSNQIAPRVPMCGSLEDIFIALDNQIYWVQANESEHPVKSSCNLPAVVTSLDCARFNDKLWLAAVCGNEVLLFDPADRWETTQLQEDRGSPPQARFLPDGNLVVADAQGGSISSVTARVATLATWTAPAGEDSPVTHLALLGGGVFATLHANNRIDIIQATD